MSNAIKNNFDFFIKITWNSKYFEKKDKPKKGSHLYCITETLQENNEKPSSWSLHIKLIDPIIINDIEANGIANFLFENAPSVFKISNKKIKIFDGPKNIAYFTAIKKTEGHF